MPDIHEIYTPNELLSTGFAVVANAFSEDVLESLREHYEDAMAGIYDYKENDRVLGGTHRQLVRPEDRCRFFLDNPIVDEALDIYTNIFGGKAQFNRSMLLTKGTNSPAQVAIHQDFGYAKTPVAPPGTPINNTLQFWVPLDDVDESNGCLHYIPRFYTETLEHCVISSNPDAPERLIEAVGVDVSEAVSVPLRAGGFTMHLGGTLHYSDGNFSSTHERRAYVFNVGPPYV